ncbi:CoA-transferase family III [Macrophomina phaseolina MS6]|uniref:CoA-transferase family III n=1 Tax=Macrophomina phaseolina (strain MS6) TaxID=1126212 RepID=K2RAN6_MACPH|nr:CoA-transferase family III [Macrophomina phaseolina MS6]
MSISDVKEDARRILYGKLLNDESLRVPQAFIDAAEKLTFTGGDEKPFLPSPGKMTESASALCALIAAASSAVATDRYGIDYQGIKVNTDIASLSLFSVILPTVDGVPFLENEQLRTEIAKGNLHHLERPLRALSTNLYQTKDSRWYYLHGDLNPCKTMKMLGIEDDEGIVSHEEALDIYKGKVAQWDAGVIEETANSVYQISGVVCHTHEEFLSSQTGKAMSKEPLYTLRAVNAPRSVWPPVSPDSAADLKPLAGIRVIDFSRVIAAPVISKVLAALGAEVMKVTWKNLPDHGFLWVDLSAGKRDADIDLKSDEGRASFSALLKDADVLIDGYRPGVLSRLGFDTETLRKISPRLIVVRENCYGWKGPLSHRSGWQPISDCLVGHSWLQGKFLGLDEPVLPPLPNSDMQTGYTGAAATIQALYMRTKSDVTFDVDVSLTQYNTWLYRLGQYTEEQQRELRQRNSVFHARHSDRVQALLAKTYQAVAHTRPDIFEHPEYFWTMSGKEWGVESNISILAPAFDLERSKLEYAVPSGSRGRSRPAWIGSP